MKVDYFGYFLRGLAFPLSLIGLAVGHSIWVGEPLSNLMPDYSWARLLLPYRESISLVIDLPDIPELYVKSSGYYLDLGYLHKVDGSMWVARMNSTSYYELTPQLRDTLLTAAHLSQLPPVPPTPWTSYITKPAAVVFGLLLMVVVMVISKVIAPFVKPPRDENAFLNEERFQAMLHNQEPPRQGDAPRAFGKRI